MMRDPSDCGQGDRVATRMTIPGNMEERSDHSFDSFKWRTDDGRPRASALKPKRAHLGSPERRERTAKGSRFGSTYAKNKNPGQWKAHGTYIARDSATKEGDFVAVRV